MRERGKEETFCGKYKCVYYPKTRIGENSWRGCEYEEAEQGVAPNDANRTANGKNVKARAHNRYPQDACVDGERELRRGTPI